MVFTQHLSGVPRMSGVWVKTDRESFPQLVETSDRMRTLILIIGLSIGHGFQVDDVLSTLGRLVDETQRKSDVNDNIPAVFAATLGASLIANAVLNKPADTLNRVGEMRDERIWVDVIKQLFVTDCRCGVETGSRIVNGAPVTVSYQHPEIRK